MIKTIIGRAERSRLQSGLSKEFWTEAVDTATYLVNLGPTVSALDFGVPEEAWIGDVFIRYLRVFGCTCYPCVDSTMVPRLGQK